ncbi:hypothetical protein [Maricurvus nonylphenolicus]
MTNRNTTALKVGSFSWNAQLLFCMQVNNGKGFVDFESQVFY